MSGQPRYTLSPEDNLILRQMRGMRDEMRVILDNQIRDRELITRMFSKMEQGFNDARRDLADIRVDVNRTNSDFPTRRR
jgi:hypothetical protein